MTNKKTRHQRKQESEQRKVVALYKKISKEEGWTRTAMWEHICEKTGYTRQGVCGILKRAGINYQLNKEEKNGTDD